LEDNSAGGSSASRRTIFVLVVVLLVCLLAAGSFAFGTNSSATTTASAALCTQPSGVERVQLSSSAPFGEVTTFALPKPLKAPNSIAVAPDGSVWFGEVTLRGVAHLFVNGTLLEYAWPTSFITPQTECADLSELWGLVLWHGMVWASDSANDQLVGLTPSNDTFDTIHLASGTQPRFLALDSLGNLWFTESSPQTQIGMITSASSAPRYFTVPDAPGQITASLLFYNSTMAYVVTVNPTDNAGEIFSFDPSASTPAFTRVGGNETLLGPYSASEAAGGLWVGEHDASGVAFYNQTSSKWSFYPTSLNPEVLLTLPYYLQANGSSVWFNEHDSNKIAVISGSSLTEYNISSTPLSSGGIGNALTVAVDKNLVWFTEWTGNTVGFVNGSLRPSFSIAASSTSNEVTIAPGSAASISLEISGTSTAPLSLQYSDSESNTAVPVNLTVSSNVSSVTGLAGVRGVLVNISAKPDTPIGEYLVLVTVTDGTTYRSVYIPVEVT